MSPLWTGLGCESCTGRCWREVTDDMTLQGCSQRSLINYPPNHQFTVSITKGLKTWTHVEKLSLSSVLERTADCLPQCGASKTVCQVDLQGPACSRQYMALLLACGFGAPHRGGIDGFRPNSIRSSVPLLMHSVWGGRRTSSICGLWSQRVHTLTLPCNYCTVELQLMARECPHRNRTIDRNRSLLRNVS